MKFSVEAADFRKACVAAANSVAARASIPVLNCLHIVADDRLRVFGNNTMTQTEARCTAAITGPGVATVSAEHLVRWLKSCSGIIDATVTGDVLAMKCGKMIIKLPSLHFDDFPFMPMSDGAEIANGIAALQTCVKSAATEETRAYLCGVFFDGECGVATNGVVLTRVPATGTASATIPAIAIPAALAACGGAGRLFIGENAWRIEAEGVTFTGAVLAAGQYPDYRRIIGTPDAYWEADADGLVEAIGAATLDRAARAVLRCAGGEVAITGEGYDGQDCVSQASARMDGPETFAATFAAKLLLLGLAPHKGRIVKVGRQDMVYHFSSENLLTVVGSQRMVGT